MKRKQPSQTKSTTSIERRQFLSGLALSAGAAAVLSQRAHAATNSSSSSTSNSKVSNQPASTGYRQPPQLTDLKGKTAYITGGTTGIGLGIARACANAGMKLVLGYRSERGIETVKKLFGEDNPNVMMVKHDVTDRDGWKALLEQIQAKFGNLHLLANNAGAKILRKASEAPLADWDNAVAVNFTGIYNGCITCIPHMLKHGEGSHIVTTSSMGGLLPGSIAGVYTATKIAAVGLMEALRIELDHTNIGTSAYCPGGVSTDNLLSFEPVPGKEPPGMDPLEAGERVLNGVRNNDLFILTHPEYKAGTKERCDAIVASFTDEPYPETRAKYEQRVLTAPPYAPEIEHRKKGRKSYRA
jgi:NAD(P)-dependent dehydrogenase (short-subunit alcohol dehydrogenase family)